MADSYIMAIDEGTTSTRAVILDHAGKMVGEAQKEFTQYFPKPGWVEHDANEIWEAVLSTIADTFISSGVQPRQIAGLGITNQRETTVIWDKTTGCRFIMRLCGSHGRPMRWRKRCGRLVMAK